MVGKREELWRKKLWKRLVLSLEWKRERVMDGDSGVAGNDELTCVRSDESDKSCDEGEVPREADNSTVRNNHICFNF